MTGPEPCVGWHGLTAAVAAGGASAADTARLVDHTRDCPACAADLAELEWVAARVASVAPATRDDLVRRYGTVGPRPPVRAGEPDTGHRRRPPPARRLVAVGAAVVGLAAAVAVGVVLARPPAVGRTVALSGTPGVAGRAVLVGEPWGTQVTLEVSDRRAGEVLTVSMATTSGRWWVAGSFRSVGRGGGVTVHLTCPAPVGDVRRLAATDASGRTVLVGEVRSPSEGDDHYG